MPRSNGITESIPHLGQSAVVPACMSGSRSARDCERVNDPLGYLAGLEVCVIDLYMLIRIEEVAVRVEPILGIVFQKQGT